MARQKLIETFQGSWSEKAPIKKMALTEDKKIVESNGQKYEALGAYKVPVWRLDKRNLNERVYSTRLAEQVIEAGKATYACDGHIDNPTYEDVKAVGKNPSIEDGIMYAECYFVDDDFHKKAERLMEAGIGLGLSSSAYGDQDDDGNIMLEGFEIDRYFDFVLDPSYEVYMKEDSRVSESNDEGFSKKVTNTIEENKETEEKPTTESGKMDKKEKLSLEEKNIQLGVRNLMEKAEAKEHPKDQIASFREALDYLDGVSGDYATSMVDEITTKIATLEADLLESYDKAKESVTKVQEHETKLTEQEHLLQEAQETIKTLEEKSDIAFNMIEDFKAREIKLKEMYDVLKAEKNGMVSATQYNELVQYIAGLEKENAELKKEVRRAKRNAKPKETFVRADVRPVARPKRKKAKEDADEVYGYDKDEVYGTEAYNENVERFGYEGFEFEDHTQDDSFRDVEGVQAYYEDLLAENPNVAKIKKEILKCKTVLEAQKTYLNLYDLLGEGGNKPLKQYEAKVVKTFEPEVGRLIPNGWK